MPCHLIVSADPAVDFEGPTGKKVQLSVRTTGVPGSVELDFVFYDGKMTVTDPAEIKIVAGSKPLIVGLRGTVDGQIGNLVEICGPGSEQKLRRFKFVELDPAKNYVVEGK
jgi:hypothetical protein